jgi:DNA-binding LacI/PurR family transcriptional regulator
LGDVYNRRAAELRRRASGTIGVLINDLIGSGELGMRAAQLLLDRIFDPKKRSMQFLAQPELVLRGSG